MLLLPRLPPDWLPTATPAGTPYVTALTYREGGKLVRSLPRLSDQDFYFFWSFAGANCAAKVLSEGGLVSTV